MPYIKPAQRETLAPALGPFLEEIQQYESLTVGDLNYILTRICLSYLLRRGIGYTAFVEIEGTLSHITKEIYRRLTERYEFNKMHENGDLPEFDTIIREMWKKS